MKKLFTFLFLFFLVLNLFSSPLVNVPVTITQPDGVVLNIFTSGDEFYNWLHDKDYYTIVKDSKTGYYVYAMLLNNKIAPTNFIVGRVNPNFTGLTPYIKLPDKEILKIRNTLHKNSIREVEDAPATGTINNLVVFIRFSDDPEFTDPIYYYRSLFNNDSSGKNSMYNYFKDISYNSLSIISTFYPVPPGSTVISYQDSHSRNYYMPYDSISNPIGYTTDGDFREHTLLKNAVNAIASQIPTNLNIDSDNDGKVDNMVFIVEGAASPWGTLLWPHQYYLSSYYVLINNKRVFDYDLQVQDITKLYGTSALSHEMCHSLGIPDLYHYVDNGISPCYAWDIMCGLTTVPQHIGAHMKWKYTPWIDSIPVISSPGTYTLKPLTSSKNNCYRINSPYSSSEYYVVEFRRKALPFENYIPGSGLLVYRINPSLYGNGFGPPDEVYVYRPYGTLTANGSPQTANFSDVVGRNKINKTTNPTPFLSDGSQGGLNIYNITYLDSLVKFTLGESTGINESGKYANEFKLSQNYPNPFNPKTIIGFSLKHSGKVKLEIFDINGKLVSTLIDTYLNSGHYEQVWDASNFSSGIYFYRILTEGFSDCKSMILLK